MWKLYSQESGIFEKIDIERFSSVPHHTSCTGSSATTVSLEWGTGLLETTGGSYELPLFQKFSLQLKQRFASERRVRRFSCRANILAVTPETGGTAGRSVVRWPNSARLRNAPSAKKSFHPAAMRHASFCWKGRATSRLSIGALPPSRQGAVGFAAHESLARQSTPAKNSTAATPKGSAAARLGGFGSAYPGNRACPVKRRILRLVS